MSLSIEPRDNQRNENVVLTLESYEIEIEDDIIFLKASCPSSVFYNTNLSNIVFTSGFISLQGNVYCRITGYHFTYEEDYHYKQTFIRSVLNQIILEDSYVKDEEMKHFTHTDQRPFVSCMSNFYHHILI